MCRGHDRSAGAVPAPRRRWRCGDCGCLVLAGTAGCLACPADVAFVCDGLAALVAVSRGGGCPLGAGDPVEGRDFSLWVRRASKPRARPGPGRDAATVASAGGRDRRRRPQSRREGMNGGLPGQVNPVTGKPSPGAGYAPRTVNHSETVLRTFYDFHREAGTGPMVNPFPLDRDRRGGRSHAHHNPMDPWPREKQGRYRSTVAQVPPRAIPDEMFERLFAALSSHRDRALVAFWISTGARASELLGACQGDADPGQQMITVIRKGSRGVQQLPASPDAFCSAASLPAADARPGARRAAAAVVVDIASAACPAVLPRCTSDVRAGERLARRQLDVA